MSIRLTVFAALKNHVVVVVFCFFILVFYSCFFFLFWVFSYFHFPSFPSDACLTPHFPFGAPTAIKLSTKGPSNLVSMFPLNTLARLVVDHRKSYDYVLFGLVAFEARIISLLIISREHQIFYTKAEDLELGLSAKSEYTDKVYLCFKHKINYYFTKNLETRQSSSPGIKVGKIGK